ncbi:MAG: hypothetical protein ACKV2V_10750 [Blastocatellia bacterium]
MAQIKSYVDLASYNEITAFAGVDAERVVKSFLVTDANGDLAGSILGDLAAARGAVPGVQIITGPRGCGKSHLLAFLRSVINIHTPRLVPQHGALQQGLIQLKKKTLTIVEVSFPAGEAVSFEETLRNAVNGVLTGSVSFDEQSWRQAAEREQVFELILSLLPPDTHLILFIDELSARWQADPAQYEPDLEWLKKIVDRATALPVQAVIALGEKDLQQRKSLQDLLMAPGETAIREITLAQLRDVVARKILVKKEGKQSGVAAIYAEIRRNLPGFAWTEQDFIDWYPAHPALEKLTPALSAHTRTFSLPGFIATAVSRALNRPEHSLVTVVEAFDRFEYELRKDEATADLFAMYDRIGNEALPRLAGEDRLWGKMLAKTLALYLLTGDPIEIRTLADAVVLSEGTHPGETGYQRAARICGHFESVIPESITVSGEQDGRLWHMPPPPEIPPLREQIEQAARQIAADDPRIDWLLLSAGATALPGWPAPGDLASQLQSLASCGQLAPELARQEISWRGTKRKGQITLASRAVAAQQTSDDILFLGGELFETNPPPANADIQAMEPWELQIAPLHAGFTTTETPANVMHMRWQAGGFGAEDLTPLRMMIALRERDAAREEAAATGQSRRQNANSPLHDQPADIETLTTELLEQTQALFSRLYLEQGIFVDQAGAWPISEGVPPESLASLLETKAGAALSRIFPEHPQFTETLTNEHVTMLLSDFFSSPFANSPEVREAAEQFCLPLGLVSEYREKYRLNVFNEGANLPPFIHALVTLVELHADTEGQADVPLEKIMRLLGTPPYGLQSPCRHLILVAFISSGVYELLNETTGKRLTKTNLHLGFEPGRFTTLRRVATTDYPQEILYSWLRALTGRGDLPALTSLEAHQNVREALDHWLEDWRELNLRERFEEVPGDLMTMTTWHTVNMSIRRYERATSIVESIVDESLSIETGMSRILDLFGLDMASLEQTRQKMQSLASFLDWMPTYTIIRNYLLAAENTGNNRIDREAEALFARVREPHELLNPVARQQLEQGFYDFRDIYANFWVNMHEASVGASAYSELVEMFYTTAAWQQFKLLLQLNMEARSFENDARLLTDLIDKTRCDLPTEEILQRQPYCGCSFRLNRRLHLGSVLEAFHGLTQNVHKHYSEELWKRREEIRARLRENENETLTAAVSQFLTGCGEGLIQGLVPEIVAFLNESLPAQPVITPLPDFPSFSEGSFTREELRDNLLRWIESLPEDQGVRFRVENA